MGGFNVGNYRLNKVPFLIIILIILSPLVISALVIRALFLIVTVEQCSMNPTLFEGDRVLVLRYWPRVWLKRGQIIVLRNQQIRHAKNALSFSWESFYNLITQYFAGNYGELIIKRITGLPGDTKIIHISELDELKQMQHRKFYDGEGNRRWTIQKGQLFIEGDNQYSTDSRDWGPIFDKCVVGVAILKLSYDKNYLFTPKNR